MKILNVQSRTIAQPLHKISPLFNTLSSKNDKIWPIGNWPAIRFWEGLMLEAKGGHGPIKYIVKRIVDN